MIAAFFLIAAQCIGFDARQYPVTATHTVLVRDLNGDGAPEIITSGNQVDELGAFSLLANRGDGTFAPERMIATGFGEHLEDTGDLDGDGAPELLASNYWSNGIAVYRNLGALQFSNETPYGTATHGGPSLILDFDRDGTPDVVSFSFGSGNPVRVHFFRSTGDGTLAAKTTFDTNLANAAAPSPRMLNGALELIASERSGHLGLFHYANGVLSSSTIAAGPGFDVSAVFADVNGDGIADIIDVDDGKSEEEPVFVTLANADGSFRERTQLSARRTLVFPLQVRVVDADGDGHADLVISDLQVAALFVFRGDGAGEFAEALRIDTGGPVNAFDIGDVNRDGHPDIVTVNSDHTISVMINGGVCAPAKRRAVRR